MLCLQTYSFAKVFTKEYLKNVTCHFCATFVCGNLPLSFVKLFYYEFHLALRIDLAFLSFSKKLMELL